jgi:hypothetical protein
MVKAKFLSIKSFFFQLTANFINWNSHLRSISSIGGRHKCASSQSWAQKMLCHFINKIVPNSTSERTRSYTLLRCMIYIVLQKDHHNATGTMLNVECCWNFPFVSNVQSKIGTRTHSFTKKYLFFFINWGSLRVKHAVVSILIMAHQDLYADHRLRTAGWNDSTSNREKSKQKEIVWIEYCSCAGTKLFWPYFILFWHWPSIIYTLAFLFLASN